MNHTWKTGFAFSVTLAAMEGVSAGCGDAVLPDEKIPPEVQWIFGEVDLPDGDLLRFRLSVEPEGESHLFEQVLSAKPDRYLFAGIDWKVSYLDIGADSVFFEVSGEGSRDVSFRARNSADLYIGFTREEDAGADSTYHWEGWGCRQELGSGERPYFDPDDLAYPVRFALPPYPDTLVAGDIEGTVKLKVRVGRAGNMIRATVIRSVQDDLDSLAVQAVRDWEFYPARVGRTYVGVDEIVSLIFTASAGTDEKVAFRIGS